MTRLSFRVLAAIAVASLAALPLAATTFRPISDREMVEKADAIVRGTVIDSVPRQTTGGFIATDTRIHVEKALKGDFELNDVVTVTEYGGSVGGRTMYVVAGATYTPGQRVLAFLRHNAASGWQTYAMSIGRFAYERDGMGRAILTRATDGEADPRPRLGREFESFIDDVLRGRENSATYLIAPLTAKDQRAARTENYPAASYCLVLYPPNGGKPIRWSGGEAGGVVKYGITGTATGANGSSALDGAAAAWTGAPYGHIVLQTGDTPGTSAAVSDGLNTVYLGYTGPQPAGVLCDQSTACAILWIVDTSTHPFDNSTFYSIVNSDIIFQPGTYTQGQMNVLMAHEVGHSIGFRHADDGTTPSTSQALMASTVNVGFGANLQQWDSDAVATVYGSGPPCVAPNNVQVLNGGTVAFGSRTTLSAIASGSTPFTYQWFEVTSTGQNPIAGATGSTYTTPIMTTSSATYAVKVTNSCGNATAQTTVTPAQCINPTVTVQPQSQTIQSGQTTTLTVSLAGTPPYQYQWYTGQAPDTSQPIPGAGFATYTTPALTQTTSYWVRVLNPCSSADSSTATITIPGTCTKPSFTMQPQGFNVPAGQLTYLGATASGVTSYAWYQGTPGDTSKPLAAVSGNADARWVNAVYVDLFNQAPDAATIATLTGQLTGGATRQAVALALVQATQFRILLVKQMYSRYLGRTPSAAESAFFVSIVGALGEENVAAAILASDEYYSRSGRTAAGFVVAMVNDVLGRAATSAEVSALASLSRNAAALATITSTEGRTVTAKGIFTQFMHRDATAAELIPLAALTRDQIRSVVPASAAYANFDSMVIVGPLSAATTYWVAATNSCGTANSSGAGISQPACSKPVIFSQPVSATVDLGGKAQLAVVAASGSTYQWYRGTSGDTSQALSGATSSSYTGTPITSAGTYSYWVRVTNACGSTDSTTAILTVSCAVSTGPVLSTPGSWPSLTGYSMSWDASAATYDHFEVQEATKIDFSDATTLNSRSTSANIAAHTVTADTRYYYRVRGYLTCATTTPQPWSATASTLVIASTATLSNQIGRSCLLEIGVPCSITGKFNPVDPGEAKWGALDTVKTYTVTADEPWITFSPSSGTIPAIGPLTIDYTIDTTNQPAGSMQATATFTVSTTTPSTSGSAGAAGTTTTSTSIPVSVSLVSPVSPVPKSGNAPLNTMIIPAVAHAPGINSRFVSDLRMVNTASQSINYSLTFTPSGTDGTQTGKTLNISIAPGETKAINDVVQTWFGAGAAGEGGLGTIEIRPTNYVGKTGLSLVTVAASRTYNVTASGTFGQFIPAIPIANFLAKSATAKISLQQVAQSASFRTNLGLVEGSGQPVNLELRLYDSAGKQIAAVPWSLKAYEFQQQSFGTLFPGVTLSDGRVEVRVLSDTGNVSAYASVLDNKTSDPLAVFPVQPDQVTSQRYVLPGVADLNNGAANFHTDMRVYNGGAAAVTVTATYVPQTGSPGASAPLTFTLNPGEVKVLDDTLKSGFNVTNSGGAVVVTTAAASSLVVTARTYSRRDDGGTFGQFIPGVTSSDGVGSGDRPLQVIQLEQSPAFRSNVGLVEVTGNATNVKVSGYSPDSRVAAIVNVNLGPNEFRQLSSIFTSMGFGNTYNGRVTVEVTGGTGRVAAYGSVIDNRTQDPTYVPAQ